MFTTIFLFLFQAIVFFFKDSSCSFFFVFIIFCYCWFLINFSLKKRTVVVAHRRDSSLLSCLGKTQKRKSLNDEKKGE